MSGTARRTPADLGILIFACVFPTWAVWLYFIQYSGSQSMSVFYTATKVVQFAIPILWWSAIRHRCALKACFGGPVDVPGLIFGAAAGAAIIVLYFLVFKGSVYFEGFPERLLEKLRGFHCESPGRFILLALFISVVHSFLEEYYWRWYVLDAMRDWVRPTAALVLSALAFTSHHVLVLGAYIPLQFWWVIALFSAGIAVGGIFWGRQYLRLRSLRAPWLSHLIIDVALMLVGYDLIWGLF